jgi:taurine dioxygenase
VRAGLTIEPLGPVIGAKISGVKLADDIDDEQRVAILEAVLRHHVIFFEDQPITPEQHKALASRFGALQIHPVYPQATGVPEIIVLDTSDSNPPDNDNWHTDVTFLEVPAMGAWLSAKLLPPSGGDTLWSSNIAVWESLSPSWKQMLAGLNAEHDFIKSFPAWRFARTPEEKEKWEKARRDHPPRTHPVVRTHPVTRKQGLFVNEGFTTRIVELTPGESDSVLRHLFSLTGKPEFTVRWRWKVNDMAFWDNRLTQHYATADYMPHRRIMNRATIHGSKPFYNTPEPKFQA